MRRNIKRIGALVILGMFVMVLYSLTLTARGIPVSTESYWAIIDNDNNADNETFIVWHDGGPSDPSAEELFRIQENGRVGIGILDPQHRLDVAGTIQMTGFKMPTGASEGYVLTSDASGIGIWKEAQGGISGSGTTNFIAKFTDSTSLGDSVICEFNDNIGIGTTSPSGKLEVIGNIIVSGTVDGVDIDVAVANLIATDHILQANINSEEAARIAADNVLQNNIDTLAAIDALDYDTLMDLETAVANGFNIATISGNVGIGTLSPTEKMDIDGGLRIRDLPQDDTINNVVVADSNGVLHTRDVNTIGFQTNIITITDDYTPKDTDYTILVDASSNDVLIELPPANDAFSQVLVIKRIDENKRNTVIIDGDNSEEIDGDLRLELDCQYMSYTIQSDGSNWYILTSYGFMGKSHINNDHR
jgi:hypothetical protein